MLEHESARLCIVRKFSRMDSKLLVPIEGVAGSLGVSRRKIYELIDDGELTRVKIGRRALVTAESVHEYVERLVTAAS